MARIFWQSKTIRGAAIAVMGAIAISACGGGGGGGTSLTYAERWVNSLDTQDTQYNYRLVKDPSKQSGYVVVDDGYNYYAIDIYSSRESLYYDRVDYFDNEAIRVTYAGNGYYSDYYGNLYEMTTGTGKDLEKAAAFVEDLKADKIADQLVADYGLSEKRGLQVAKLTLEWSKLKKKRSVTDADADAFSTEILGFSLNDGIKAVKKAQLEGETSDLNALIDRAADENGLSPEQVGDLIRKFAQQ